MTRNRRKSGNEFAVETLPHAVSRLRLRIARLNTNYASAACGQVQATDTLNEVTMIHPRRILQAILGCAVCCAFGSILTGCQDVAAPVAPPRGVDLGKDTTLPPYLDGTIKSLTLAGNTGVFPVTSYGLVTGLHRTGDSTAPTTVREGMIKEMYRHGLGSASLGTQKLQPEQMLFDPHFAIVSVIGYIPPGARKKDRMDVAVQALPYPNTTSSLADGVLYRPNLRINGTSDPFGAVNDYGLAQGNIFVNPAYALNTSSTTQPTARQSLRAGTIPGGGVVSTDRPIILQVRTPSFATARAVQQRVNAFYQVNDSAIDGRVASALDDRLVNLYVPAGFRGNWQHFLGLTRYLFMNSSPEFAAIKARELAEVALRPEAALLDISYAWEGLGPVALPFITPLLTNGSQDVQYAAARAAAFLGDRYGEDMLLQIARTTGHSFQVNAVEDLSQLRNSGIINAGVAELLDSDNALVRIEAYNLLVKQNDPRILTKVVRAPGSPDTAFFLDMVPSNAAPLIYCTRVGQPRVAVFGRKVTLKTPMTFAAFDTRLVLTTMNDQGKAKTVKIIYREPGSDTPLQVASSLDVAEFIGRMGGLSDEGLHFNYGDIVAILQALSDPKSQKLAAAFKLQDPRMDGIMPDTSLTPVGQPNTVGRPQAAGDTAPTPAAEDLRYPAGRPESVVKQDVPAPTAAVDAPKPQ